MELSDGANFWPYFSLTWETKMPLLRKVVPFDKVRGIGLALRADLVRVRLVLMPLQHLRGSSSIAAAGCVIDKFLHVCVPHSDGRNGIRGAMRCK